MKKEWSYTYACIYGLHRNSLVLTDRKTNANIEGVETGKKEAIANGSILSFV
jgi:hypothetical protein